MSPEGHVLGRVDGLSFKFEIRCHTKFSRIDRADYVVGFQFQMSDEVSWQGRAPPVPICMFSERREGCRKAGSSDEGDIRDLSVLGYLQPDLVVRGKDGVREEGSRRRQRRDEMKRGRKSGTWTLSSWRNQRRGESGNFQREEGRRGISI